MEAIGWPWFCRWSGSPIQQTSTHAREYTRARHHFSRGWPEIRWQDKLLRINTANDGPIMLGGSGLQAVETFTYLRSIVNNHGGTDANVKTRMCKARIVFLQLKNVKSVLLFGSETWRTTMKTTRKVETFIHNCLRRILKIHWPKTISNVELWQQEPIENWKGDGVGLGRHSENRHPASHDMPLHEILRARGKLEGHYSLCENFSLSTGHCDRQLPFFTNRDNFYLLPLINTMQCYNM